VAHETPFLFDLPLPPLTLEAGARLSHHVVRGWCWTTARDRLRIGADVPDSGGWQVVRRSWGELAAVARKNRGESFRPDIPTVLIVHALTGDARAGGPGGWWEPLIGPDAPFDPTRMRILCFNLLGSCYGTSGPCDEGFPCRLDDRRFDPPAAPLRGHFPVNESDLPATVTTWDQARSLLMALDAVGIGRVDLVTGGSLGGMIALCLAALAPERFARVAPIAATDAASPWILAFNHVARQAILADPGWPTDPSRGLEIARQLAMITYRAEYGFDQTQGRRMAVGNRESHTWSSRAPYRISTYLEHQGQKLRRRFDARSYVCLLGSMDHHDLNRPPPPFQRTQADREAWGLCRIRSSVLGVKVDTDQLYLPAQTDRWTAVLGDLGVPVETAVLHSPHGHDSFLIEWDQMKPLMESALALPPYTPAPSR
jgi:homoserine O-acetyltransferase